MNHHMAEGRWQQLSGKIKQKWGKLTDDDLTRAAGDREYLVGKLHEQYGIARDRAESELENLGYGEHDEERDLRSSTRSSAGRMDLAGEPGGGRKLEAGFANAGSRGSGFDDQGEASGYEQSRDSSLGNRDQEGNSTGSGYRKLQAGGSGQSDVDSQDNADNGGDQRSGDSQEAADYQPAGHTLEASPGRQELPSGKNAGRGGSRSPSQRSGDQQKGGSNTPSGGSNR